MLPSYEPGPTNKAECSFWLHLTIPCIHVGTGTKQPQKAVFLHLLSLNIFVDDTHTYDILQKTNRYNLMAFKDVVSNIIFKTNDEVKNDILFSLRRLYSRSNTAKASLDRFSKISDKKLTIKFARGQLNAGRTLGSFEINYDPKAAARVVHINENGKVVNTGKDFALIHEFFHAVEGLDDNYDRSVYGDQNIVFPGRKPIIKGNLQGETVIKTNKVRREFGIKPINLRISYPGTAFSSELPLGRDYTGGKKIDVAVLGKGKLDTSNNKAKIIDLLIGKKGKDNFFNAGKGNDFLYGGDGDDTLIGGQDQDLISGGSGTDIAQYSGNCSDYSITSINSRVFTIIDNRKNRPDGSDTLQDVEIAQFADGQVRLSPGQVSCPGSNIIIAIDVSGSMRDDIDAVKTSASSIVEAIFGSDEEPIASRLGIISFNDSGSINTVLDFTDQENISDRKKAALQGIQSVNILGGGAEPLNGALLSALQGDAGTWTEGSFDNRIIVFSDEPAADPELRTEVLRLAGDINVDISEGSTSRNSVESSYFELDGVGPEVISDVEQISIPIFPVLVGNDEAARIDFQELAEDTGGRLISAEDSTEVVSSLLEAIDTEVESIAAINVGLYDVKTGDLISNLDSGSEILLSEIDGRDVTIAAFIPEESSIFGSVGSVKLDVNNGQISRKENSEPYTLFGDIDGNFFKPNSRLSGSNTLSLDFFSEKNLKGDSVLSTSIDFEVIDDLIGEEVNLGIYNTRTNDLVEDISDGETIFVRNSLRKNITVAAIIPNDSPFFDTTESVVLSLNGSSTRVENNEPYALSGDKFGNFFMDNISLEGNNEINIKLYSENKAQGLLISEISRSFTINFF